MALDENTENTISRIIAAVDKRKGPASEQTLLEIQELLKGDTGLGAVKDETGGVVGALKRLKKRIFDVEDGGEFLQDSFDAIKITTRAAAGGMEGMTRGLYELGALTGGISGKFLQALGRASEVIFDNVQAFRSLANVGANATLDLEFLREASGRTGIDMNTLVGETQRLAKEFTLLTGSPSAGLNRFLSILETFNNGDFRRQFASLGLTTADLAEQTGTYLELQTRLGRAQSMTQGQLTAGAEGFILQLDELARLTGQQKDAIQQELRTQANDRRIRLLGNKEMQDALARVSAQLPELRDSFVNIIGTGFPRSMEEIGISTKAGVMEAVRAIREGVPGASEQLIAALGAAAQEVNSASDAERLKTQTLVNVTEGFFNVDAALVGFQKITEQNTEETKKQIETQKLTQSNLLNLDQASERLRTSFLSLVSQFTPVFDALAGGLEFLATNLTKLTKLLTEKFGALGTTLGTATSAVAIFAAGLVAVKGGKAAIGGVKSLFGGGGPQNQLQNVAPGTGGMLGGLGMGLKGFAGGLRAFANPMVVLGAGALGASITLVGAGIAGATYLMGGALEKFGEGLKTIGDVDGKNLLEVAKGSTALAGAMVALAGGGTVSAVTGFFGKLLGGGTDNFAKNVNNMLDDLDKNKIDMYATSINNLGESMQSLSTGMQTVTTGAAKGTGDKLDQLNSTMQEILMVMSENTRYAKSTSRSSTEVAEAI